MARWPGGLRSTKLPSGATGQESTAGPTGSVSTNAAGPVEDRVLALQREVQGLKLELRERDRRVTQLQEELERQRGGESARVTEAAQQQLERLMEDAAAPVAQLVTQASLLEREGKLLQAKDVLAVSRRLVRALQDHGLTLEGAPGESAPFDPARHEPLSSAVSVSPGQTVVVRIPGASYGGRILRKAGVESMGKGSDARTAGG